MEGPQSGTPSSSLSSFRRTPEPALLDVAAGRVIELETEDEIDAVFAGL
jgi:hypothetical protein